MWRLTLFFLGTMLFTLNSSGQRYSLELIATDNKEVVDKLTWQKEFTTIPEREKELNRILQTLYENAYLAASIDSLKSDSLNLIAYITIGDPYKWAILGKGNVDEDILSQSGFREKLYKGKPLHYKDVLKVQEKILKYCENNGYPFAAVKLDSIHIQDLNFSAQLHLEKNKLTKIDSIIITGDARITTVYLYNYIGIKPGTHYNESAVKNISARIKELPFLTENKAPIIDFTDKFTRLYLFLEKKKASQFDGIVGVLPDNNTGKIMLTGDVRLKLQNSLGRGELIELNWRSLAKNTQDLKTHFSYPFIFSTPFGLDYSLKLYKKDTSFIDVNQNMGIQYLLKGNNYLKAFYNSRKSSLLSTKGMETLTVLPPYADINANTYGLGFQLEKFDYRFNPRKGFGIAMTGSAGNRTIQKNARLNPLIYENLDLKTAQYEANMTGVLFLPLFQRSTLRIGAISAWIHSKSIFQNELYRIGGLKTLRGFDEESIFASAYVIGSLEYRYLLEENSYLYLFTDAAYYENLSVTFTGDRYDNPLGFGAGVSFETKAGIFSINYALGKQFNNPIYLKSGKVHFGIINFF